jgi:hypothetical protein
LLIELISADIVAQCLLGQGKETGRNPIASLEGTSVKKLGLIARKWGEMRGFGVNGKPKGHPVVLELYH